VQEAMLGNLVGARHTRQVVSRSGIKTEATSIWWRRSGSPAPAAA